MDLEKELCQLHLLLHIDLVATELGCKQAKFYKLEIQLVCICKEYLW
jgi:hypothetical protein